MVDWFFLNFFSVILFWWPWISLWSDLWILQFFIFYVFFLIFFNFNIYYTLLYLFIQFFYFGLFLSVIQMELFTGFLWVIECTIIFISLIFLFYLNSVGTLNKINLFFFNYNYIYIFFFFFLNIFFLNNYENFLPVELNLFNIWEDFYESVYNTNNNDFTTLLYSYYQVNSLEFIVFGLILLIGSLLCVNLFKISSTIKMSKYDSFFSFFNLYLSFINFSFFRKQNLFYQQKSISATKIFKKKKI